MNGFHVNAHLHTPYSFSAFESIDQALDLAAAQEVRVVGINDFYTRGGYAQWHRGAVARGLYPLFSVELIALDAPRQALGERLNDPSNGGRMYVCGKGMAFPEVFPPAHAALLDKAMAQNDAQVRAMMEKVNALLSRTLPGVQLEEARIRGPLFRERHLARGLREALHAAPGSEAEAYTRLLGTPLQSPLSNPAAVENELRNRLLKKGGAAFVEEDPALFLPAAQVVPLIESGGGLPFYPVLGDMPNGSFTPFEENVEALAKSLTLYGFKGVEFIPSRNTTAVLERYATTLYEQGFIVTFGSEHNTPAMEPLRLRTRDSEALSPLLFDLNYKGACLLAAHQYLYRRQALLSAPTREERLQLGDHLISHNLL